MHNGIDLGLRTTAVASLNDEGEILFRDQWGSELNKVFKNAIHANPVYRMQLYRDKLISYITTNTILGTWILEDPKGKLMGNSIKLLELKGIYLMTISDYTPYTKIFCPQPSEIKKFFAGTGSATKEQMIQKAKELGYGVGSSHTADSLAMARMSVFNYKFKGDYTVV